MVHESNPVIYADDICIIISTNIIIIQVTFGFVRDGIRAIEQWSTNNFLTLNSSKGKHMLFSRKQSNCLNVCIF